MSGVRIPQGAPFHFVDGLERPVLTRDWSFTYRPQTIESPALGADPDVGRLPSTIDQALA